MTPASGILKRSALHTASFVAVYTVALLVGMVLSSPSGISALWTCNGVLVCALLMLKRRQAAFCIGLFVALNLAVSLGLGRPPLRAIGFSVLNVGEGVLLAWLTTRVCGKNLNFSDGRRLIRLLAGAVVPASAASALGLIAYIRLVHLDVPADLAQLWFIGHVLGAAMAIPAAITIVQHRRFDAMRRPALEFAAAMGLLLALCVTLFAWRSDSTGLFLIFPVMMLIAFRYGPVGAATGSVILGLMCAQVVNAGLHHMSVGGAETLKAKVEWLQFFIAVVFLTTLPASGAVASYARMRGLLARRTQTARDARSRADAAAHAKGEFLANMSHEIRTPLNGVIGLADALSRTEMRPPQREMLKMILDSGKALTGLLSDALDLARADSGALELVDDAFDLRETIGSAAYLFETIAVEKGLNFNVRFDLIPPGAAVGDALRIKQVVSNLISNAVKFTATGGVTVEVGLVPSGKGRLRMSVLVHDTGPGFGPEVKARLFHRFEQGDSSVTRRYGGSGLGLSIAHRLTQMMGGRLDCESSPGEGATFIFEVELAQAAATASTLARTPSPGAVAPVVDPKAARSAVLLAEDHPINRKVIQAMLGDTVELTAVEDGAAAVEAFSAQRFDVILMDTHMPVMDGLTAIRAIRAEEGRTGAPRTPIVSLTADAMPQQVEAALAAGADLHVAKPITGESLYAALDTCARLRGGASPLAAAG